MKMPAPAARQVSSVNIATLGLPPFSVDIPKMSPTKGNVSPKSMRKRESGMAAEHIGGLERRRALAAAAVALVALGGGCTSGRTRSRAPDPDDVTAIEALLAAQGEAWNRGDLHDFVAGYAASERMTFVGAKGTITRGRAELEERYRKAYPSGQEGRLTFDELEIRRVGPDAYVVLGRWALARPPDDPHGRFTLVLERGDAGMEIIHDHSSDAD